MKGITLLLGIIGLIALHVLIEYLDNIINGSPCTWDIV
jgi:hypothetical protein